jgi:tetratricopeptide (TPR) repeat protein
LERHAVSYEKGCFLGQEVVARLRAYGAVKQALMGLVVESAPHGPLNADAVLFIDGKRVGQLKSSTFSPTLNAVIALAMLDRNHRTPGAVHAFMTESGMAFRARVVVLPFYEAQSRGERARELYNDALARFERDAEDVDPSAIPLLKEAVLLDPAYEDAYEALGVILHRQHRVDEAIHYMQRLARINPNCLMAHTNLSVFYVAKGMIEAAEEEKAKAAVLGIQRASDERKAKELAEAERRRLEHEARERIGMFLEVLEIDPDDAVATFGLGKAYIQLNQYAEAIPHLTRATEVQKDFSAAYLNLGKCHEFMGDPENAAIAYHRGIEAASRKGDLMPLREMERRLNALAEGGVAVRLE